MAREVSFHAGKLYIRRIKCNEGPKIQYVCFYQGTSRVFLDYETMERWMRLKEGSEESNGYIAWKHTLGETP